MLSWAVTFFLIAVVAAIFGFTGAPNAVSTGEGIAQILFVIFLGLFIVALLLYVAQGKPPRPRSD